MVNEDNLVHQDKGDDKTKPAEGKKRDGAPEKDLRPGAGPDRELNLPDELAQYEPPIMPGRLGDEEMKSLLASELGEAVSQQPAIEKQAHRIRRFSLVLPLGGAVKRQVLISFLAEHLNIDPLAAERRIVLGKGILLRGLDYDAALDLQTRFKQAGQHVLIVAQDPRLEFGPPQEIFAIHLSGSILEVLTNGERICMPRDQVILIGCGSVRTGPGVLIPKNVIDFFSLSPQHLFRIWETTFNFKSLPFTSGAIGEENFLNLAKYLVQQLPRARGTPKFITMIERHLLSPQLFESLEEYDHYNQWILLNHYGENV